MTEVMTKDNVLDLCDKYIFVISKEEFGVPPKRISSIHKRGIVTEHVTYYWTHILSDILSGKFDYYISDTWLNGYASRELLDKYAKRITDVQIGN